MHKSVLLTNALNQKKEEKNFSHQLQLLLPQQNVFHKQPPSAVSLCQISPIKKKYSENLLFVHFYVQSRFKKETVSLL